MNFNEEIKATPNLARLVGCLSEQEFASLAGVKTETIDSWRRHGKGPDYVLLGRSYLYPLESVRQYIAGKTKEMRSSLTPSMMLV